MTTNLMLGDEDLTRLLGETAESFPVPDEGPGFVLEELAIASPRPGWSRLVKWTAVAAALVVGVLVVQSFAGAGNPSTKQQLAGKSPTSVANMTMRSDGSAATSGKSTWTSSMAPEAPIAQPSAPSYAALPSSPDSLAALTQQQAAHAPTSGAGSAAGVGDAFADSAKIVKTGSIALIVGDGKVSGVVVKVQGIAAGAGGYVSNQKSQEFGDDPTSTVTVRVPVSRFDRVVQAVRDQVKNGVGKVDSSSTSGQDVTAQYADVTAQIQSLTAARDRFLTILSRANTIGETLSVQQRVDSTQLQIDQLKGRMRVLADQTSMGTLTVTVSEKAKAETKPHVQSGLSRSFDNAKNGFTSGVESLISKSGKGLLALILAVVALVILRTGWRLARRRLV
ncbi:MAG: putative lipoprotein [Frankiales bacterium]|nr:putative lipoprotein [Frankiales bacterium]